jgi:RNA polymerase sigma factor (sigma-70 family)
MAASDTTHFSRAEQFLIDQIRQGRSDAWTQLVDRYQGRLVAFARSRVRNDADAEDLVQETFLSFLKNVGSFRQRASIETFLFTILRRKVIDNYRGRKGLRACLIQDVMTGPGEGSAETSPMAELAAPEATGSWYARRDEQHDLQRDALGEALRQVVGQLTGSLNFRDLKIVELLFYGQQRNKDIAELTGVTDNQVALIKHRCLKQVRSAIEGRPGGQYAAPVADEAILTQVWEDLRLSCPKRSTIGALLLGTLEPDWADYVSFHLERLGCRFCQANYEDLQRQSADSEAAGQVRDRILQSTVGFLRKG